jgi:hypothetical protein
MVQVGARVVCGLSIPNVLNQVVKYFHLKVSTTWDTINGKDRDSSFARAIRNPCTSSKPRQLKYSPDFAKHNLDKKSAIRPKRGSSRCHGLKPVRA